MSIFIGTSGQNLIIKAIKGSETEKADKEKISSLKTTKIPIYKADMFLYWEIPKESLPSIYSLWNDNEIVIDLKAQPFIDKYKFDSIPIEELKRESLTFSPLDNKTLRDYQLDYITIDYRKNLLSVMSMGTGKTICSLLRAKNQGFEKAVVVTLKQVFPDWGKEIRATLGCQYTIYSGSPKQRAELDLDVPIIIINYEQLKELNNKNLKFDKIIIDEAHSVGNMSTKAFKEVKRLIRNNKNAGLQLLTGSPLEDRLDELYTLLHLVNPNKAGSKDKFLNRYQQEIAWKTIRTKWGEKKIPIKFRTKNLDHLREFLKCFMVRVNLSDYTSFEDSMEIITCSMTPRQTKAYEQIREEILFEIDNKDLKLENALTRMLRLTQAAEGMFNLSESNKESGKLEYLKEELDKATGKVIVWSRFKQITYELNELYPDKSVIINGDKSDNYKMLARWAFNGCKDDYELQKFYEIRKSYPEFKFEPGKCPFLFQTMNLKSGVGTNYESCNYQIVSSFDWSAKSMMQALSRIKRLTTTFDTVYTKFLVAENTLEPQVLSLILNKIKKISQILDGSGNIESIRTDEILRLLRCQ